MNKTRNLLLFWLVGWLVFSNLFILYRFVGLNWSEEVLVFSAKEWWILFAQASFIGVFSGIFFGLLDLYVNRKNYLHRLSFGLVLFIKSFGYSLSGGIALFLGFVLAALANDYNLNNAIDRAIQFFSSSYFVVIAVYIVVHTILLNFLLQVNEKFGAGNFIKIFLGRYYHPVEENRIFAFIDLRSSTTYAELLGHIKYSKLIQDCFYDITSVVEQHEAEIYQYVGDEVVLTWRAQGHKKQFELALLSFFNFQEKINNNRKYYLKKYSLVPEFKAGFHAGVITATEVGQAKKEIAYHGDAINTAARIQEQCNIHESVALCSKYFMQKLGDSTNFKTRVIGEVSLKGKEKPVQIYDIEFKPNSSGNIN